MTRSGSPSVPSGLAASVAGLIDHAPPLADDAGQGSLFGALPDDPDAAGELAPLGRDGSPRGRGRPPGSRNRSTDEWSRFILTRYRSPLLGLAEIAQATPKQLQAALGGEPMPAKEGSPASGVSLAECLKIIMQAQTALAPYLHQRQPLAIDAGGVGMMTVIIEKGDGASIGAARILPIEDAEEIEGNQGLGFSDGGMSE